MGSWLKQASFTAGELAPVLYGRNDLAKYQAGLRTCRNFIVQRHGGVRNRPGTTFVTAAKDETHAVRLIPFVFSQSQTYILELGENYLRVIHDGALVADNTPQWLGDTAYALGQRVKNGSHPSRVYVCSKAGTSAPAGGPVGTGSGINDGTPPNEVHWDYIYDLDDVLGHAFELVTPWAAADLAQLKFAQSADVLFLVHPSYAPQELRRYGHEDWRLVPFSLARSIVLPAGFAITAPLPGALPDATHPAKEWSWVVAAVADNNMLEESLPSNSFYPGTPLPIYGDRPYTLNWPQVAGVKEWNVYRGNNGIYGYVGTVSNDRASGGYVIFVDDVQVPAYGDVPPEGRDPFASSNYPSTVCFFQQRLAFGGSATSPQTVWMSKSGLPRNFDVAIPTNDDDAVTFTFAGRSMDEIRNLLPMRQLLALTAGGEWSVTGGSETPIVPTSIDARCHSYRGSAWLDPVIVGSHALFLQHDGGAVRELVYDSTQESLVAGDVSVLSAHLFDGHLIVSWTYQQAPSSIVWAVREDGKLLGLTYLREHEVVAWHRHDTDGSYRAVACVPEADEDVVYAVVDRTVGGVSRRYIERFADRSIAGLDDSHFVDCGKVYDAPATVFTGLDHLEGRTVAILADGFVLPQQTVASGQVTLDQEYTHVHIGLPYVSDLETLDLQTQDANVRAHTKTIPRIAVEVEQCRALWAGPDYDNLTELPVRSVADGYTGAVQPATDFVEVSMGSTWDKSGRVVIRNTDPVPIGILSVLPEVVLGG